MSELKQLREKPRIKKNQISVAPKTLVDKRKGIGYQPLGKGARTDHWNWGHSIPYHFGFLEVFLTHMSKMWSMCRFFKSHSHVPLQTIGQSIASSYWYSPLKTPQLIQPLSTQDNSLPHQQCNQGALESPSAVRRLHLDCGKAKAPGPYQENHQGAPGVTTASCCLSWEFDDKSVLLSWIGWEVEAEASTYQTKNNKCRSFPPALPLHT